MPTPLFHFVSVLAGIAWIPIVTLLRTMDRDHLQAGREGPRGVPDLTSG